jgi:hypothetical protein
MEPILRACVSSQKDMLSRYAKDTGFQIANLLMWFFRYNFRRPSIQKMLEAFESDLSDLYKQDLSTGRKLI